MFSLRKRAKLLESVDDEPFPSGFGNFSFISFAEEDFFNVEKLIKIAQRTIWTSCQSSLFTTFVTF
jgi:hypothetical protein